MPFPNTWLQAIVLGSLLNFLLFFSLTTLSKKVVMDNPAVLTVEFMAWQEPQKVEPKPEPIKKVPPKPKPKEPLKKKIIKKPELSVAEPIEPPVETPVEEVIEEPIVEEVVEEVLPTPVPIFEVSSLPRFVHRQAPVYPEYMKQQGKEGTVLIEALVDAKGVVRTVKVIQSAGDLFDQAAIAAIQGSTFIPANTNGNPVPVLLRVPIRFRLR
ncbi:MAG: hypothetical protein AUK35_02520 [Zetaproteobacteria bacterium CG2_30_46_52]|nr:MAG: hypothetical protein AUK35_02520 [Zetaproteobacteria bacterium CG2_30_46_52]